PVEPRLAHARVSYDGDDLAVALARPVERVLQLLELAFPTHEPRESPPGRGLQPRAGCAGPGQLEYLHRLAQALYPHRTEPRDLHQPLGQAQRARTEPNAAGRRQLLHARRQLGRLPDRRVVHAEVAPDRMHDHIARVEADANLYLHAVRPAQLGRVALHGLLHPERGVAGAHRVVLVGD